MHHVIAGKYPELVTKPTRDISELQFSKGSSSLQYSFCLNFTMIVSLAVAAIAIVVGSILWIHKRITEVRKYSLYIQNEYSYNLRKQTTRFNFEDMFRRFQLPSF